MNKLFPGSTYLCGMFARDIWTELGVFWNTPAGNAGEHGYSESYTWDDVQPGDQLSYINSEGSPHVVIAIEKSADTLRICEGNYNGMVHWDRIITKDAFNSLPRTDRFYLLNTKD